MPKFRRTVIISDGIRGHYHQSLGVAEWMERLSGTPLDPATVTIPNMTLFERVMKLLCMASKYTAAHSRGNG